MPKRPPRLSTAKREYKHEWDRNKVKGNPYGSAWKKIRNAYMAQHVLCADPDGRHPNRVVPADDCDHIIPICQGGETTWDNLQALCRACHKAKTARESARARGIQ